jgi:acetolactate synthase-1/2/3 large subunit
MLIEEGVDLVYGYPGGAIMPVYDELYKFKINCSMFWCTNMQRKDMQEQLERGVAIATSGPGATQWNLMHKLIQHLWFVFRTRLENICWMMPFRNDIIGISTPVTKWNYQITEASEIPEIMAKLFIADQDVQDQF